jgi:hypothetical protein
LDTEARPRPTTSLSVKYHRLRGSLVPRQPPLSFLWILISYFKHIINQKIILGKLPV